MTALLKKLKELRRRTKIKGFCCEAAENNNNMECTPKWLTFICESGFIKSLLQIKAANMSVRRVTETLHTHMHHVWWCRHRYRTGQPVTCVTSLSPGKDASLENRVIAIRRECLLGLEVNLHCISHRRFFYLDIFIICYWRNKSLHLSDRQMLPRFHSKQAKGCERWGNCWWEAANQQVIITGQALWTAPHAHAIQTQAQHSVS